MAVDYDVVVIGTTRVGWWLAKAAAERDARVAWLLCADHLNQNLDLVDFAQAQARGVSIIPGGGQFSDRRRLVTGQGRCSARAFVITLPNLASSELGFEPPAHATELVLPSFRCQSLVVGDQPIACAWAQKLARSGHGVRLVTLNSRILPDWQPEISRSLQAQLESEGVEVYTCQVIHGIKPRNQGYQVLSDRQSFVADQVFLPQHWSIYQDLALARAKVRLVANQVQVNSYGQTSNPCIYWAEHLADVEVVLSNVLYLPWRQQSSRLKIGHTQPPIVKLEARNFKLKRGLVRLKLQTDNYISELVCDRQGQILAFWGMGEGVIETAEMLMVAQAHRLKIQDLRSSSSLAGQLAWQFEARQLQNSPLDWRWHWFNLRRDLGSYLR